MEVAGGLLYYLVDEPTIDEGFLSAFGNLPADVQFEFMAKLRELKEKDFLWFPPLLGRPASPPDPRKYSSKLRFVWDWLEQRHLGCT
jgi:hypothetical protein